MIAFYQNTIETAIALLLSQEKLLPFETTSLHRHRDGDRQGEASSLGNLGNAYYSLGEYQKVIEYYQQYLDIAREFGDRTATQFIGSFNRFSGSNGIVETNREGDRCRVWNLAVHANDIVDVLYQGIGLHFRVTGIEQNALHSIGKNLKKTRQFVTCDELLVPAIVF